MNSPLLRWLFDLDVIPQDAEGLQLAWERPLPAWMWVLLAAVAALVALWSYRRLAGLRAGRMALAGVRCVVLLLALIIISGPMLELPRETIEPDWVLMLADRSASMTIADAPGADSGRRTREAQLQEIISEQDETWRILMENRQVQWLGFHSSAFRLEDAAADEAAEGSNERRPAVPALGDPVGDRTSLHASIEQALQRAAARPVSGIVLLTDGRTNDAPSRALLRRLEAERIPLFVVPLGSEEPMGDLAVKRIEAPRRAFVSDKVPVVVEIDRLGAAGAMPGAVRLIDTLSGATLDEVKLDAGDERDRITLTAQPELVGEATWQVVIETEQPDLIPDNNRRSILIELIDRPLRVLYVDGYPRWEYTFLKNLLVREESIDSSVMLLSADRDFAQEGNQPITRLPRSADELARFDVIVLGDAPATFFSPDQLEMIRAHIADRGAGLLWIGGSRFTPSSYAGTVLADLLPMRGNLQMSPIEGAVNVEPTDLAERLGVLQLLSAEGPGWPEELRDPAFGWSQLFYAQHIEPGRLKPTAEVLAQTVRPRSGGQLPLVMLMRYGAGQTIYVATDEIWRWRYGRGDFYPDQFWIQMVRMLGRESLTTAGDRAILDVSPRRLEVNQPMRVTLRLQDAALIDNRRSSITAVLETEEGQRIADLELRPLPDSEDRFATTYLPEHTGQLRVRVEDPTLPDLALMMPVEVFAPDDELRRPQTDHELLKGVAQSTGGEVLSGADLAKLPELLPNRAVRTLDPLRERIWDTPLAFILVLLALTAEWIGRKVLRLA